MTPKANDPMTAKQMTPKPNDTTANEPCHLLSVMESFVVWIFAFRSNILLPLFKGQIALNPSPGHVGEFGEVGEPERDVLTECYGN